MGCNPPRLADATRSNHDGFGLEYDEASLLAPVSECAGDAVAIFEQARDRAFHVDVKAERDAAVLQGADHLEASTIANMAKPLKSMPTEGPLQDASIFRAIEKRSPLFKLPHAVRRLLGVQLRHAPVVQQLAAAHGVAEVCAPVVGLVHVGHGSGDAAFCHHSMCFAEKRFADHAHARALGQSFNGGAQSRAPGPDDQDIMFAQLIFPVQSLFAHSSLRSRMPPVATRRMHKSTTPTQLRLAHANSMCRSLR